LWHLYIVWELHVDILLYNINICNVAYSFIVWIGSEFEVVSVSVTGCLRVNLLLCISVLTQFGVRQKVYFM